MTPNHTVSLRLDEHTIDALPVAIAICDETTIRYANAACLQLWGASSLAELAQHTASQQLRARLHARLDDATQPQTTYERVTRLNGEDITLEIHFRPLKENEHQWLLVSMHDITDQWKTRRALQRKTVQMQTAAEVARDATAATSLEELLNQAVNLVRERFHFYHAGIFLIDEERKYAVLVAATGEAGRKLLAQGHRLEVGKVGLVGYVAGTGKPRIALDVGEDAVHFKQPLLPDTRSEMALPLTVNGVVIGVLDVQSTDEAAFDQDDIEVLQTMADQLALAIHKMRVLHQAEQRAEQLASLYQTALTMASSLDGQTIIEQVFEQARRMLAPDAFALVLYDERDDALEIKLAWENGQRIAAIENKRYSAARGGLSAFVIRQRRTLLINDFHEETLPVQPIFSPGDRRRIRTWIGVPLIAGEHVLGMLTAQSYRRRAFSPDQQKFLQTLAAQTAGALTNVRLYQAAEKRATELETLRQINLRLTATPDPEHVLDAVLEGVFRLLPDLRAAHIFTYDGENLHFGAARQADGRHDTPIASPRRDGLTYRVARSGERIIVEDMTTHELYASIAAEKGWIGSIVGLPLKVENRVLGVMTVSRERPHSFTEEELRVLQLLGDQAALLLENANLFSQMRATLQHISLLYEVGKTVSSQLDVETILHSAVQITCRALNGVCALAFEHHPPTNSLFLKAAYVQKGGELLPHETDEGHRLPLGIGVAGWVGKNKKALLLGNVRQDERWDDHLALDASATAVIAAPILADNNHLIGVLSVYHTEENAFSDEHLALLEAICQQISLAYTNARRYQEINHLVDRLAAQQHRLESLIKELPVGVLLFDDENHLISSNDTGKVLWEHLEPAFQGDRLVSIADYAVEDIRHRHEEPLPLEITRPGPPAMRFEMHSREISIGDEREWLLMIRDVTREREIQERIQMQDRLAVVGQLAAGIAHDFNNIMAAIVIYADLMQADTTISENSREYLSIIQRQVERATSLIRQILDFSRRSVIEQVEFDLLPFIKEIEKLLQRILPENITTEVIHHQESYPFYGDPTRMQQVLFNLAVNARDAMPEGGTLRFELQTVHLTEEDTLPSPYLSAGEWIRLTVSDTGIGIAPEHLPRIFEPFFTTKGVGKGTGLGLAQVYGIVKQHNGVIDVRSQPGKGTTFYLYLPLHKSQTAGESGETTEQHFYDGRGRKVLLVEDDAAIRQAVADMLRKSNFAPHMAINGQEALQILQEKGDEIELVITDLVMPLMGGEELYLEIKKRWPRIKVLFITGHPLSEGSNTLLASGDVPWLQKPFSIVKIQQTLHELLES